MNSLDPLVRHARSLQLTADVADGLVHINHNEASRLGLADADKVVAEQGELSIEMPVVVDERVADGCVLIHARQAQSCQLGPWFGEINLRKA